MMTELKAEVTSGREQCRRAAVSAFRVYGHEPPSCLPYLNVVEVGVRVQAAVTLPEARRVQREWHCAPTRRRPDSSRDV